MFRYLKRLEQMAPLVGSTFLVASCIIQPAAFAATFSLGNGVYPSSSKSVSFYAEGETVIFSLRQNHILHMYGDNGKNDCFSFVNYKGYSGMTDYSVYKLEMQNPQKTFFIVTGSQGAHGQNVGYWIVGKYKGQWTTFVSLDTLVNAGYTVEDWHRLNSQANNTTLLITSTHQYMPPGAKFGYQAQNVIDFQAALQWDDNAGWFSIARIR